MPLDFRCFFAYFEKERRHLNGIRRGSGVAEFSQCTLQIKIEFSRFALNAVKMTAFLL